MKLDGLAFDKDRLKGLDAEAVQCRSAVQHDRMLGDDLFKDIPDGRLKTLDHLLGALDVVRGAVLDKFLHDERLKQLDRHFLGQTALIDLKFRTDDDNGTARIVDTLAEQVLTETAALAFKHIAQGLQRAVAGACDRTASAAVVDQGVDRFLEHTLFVADDDFRRAQLKELFQTVIAVDDPSVKIVEVGGRETAAVQLDHRTEIRRNDRDDIHDHPLRTVAGLAESFHDFQSFDNTGSLLAGGFLKALLKLGEFLLEVNGL